SSGLAVVSAIVTQSLTPSNLSARPNLPATRTASRIVPFFADAEESIAVVPDASSNPSASTRPLAGGGVVTTGPSETEIAMLLPSAAVWPAGGFWLMTDPAATVALLALVTAPSVNPAAV